MKNSALIAVAIVVAVAVAGYFYLEALEAKAIADDEAREDQKAIEQLRAQTSFANSYAAMQLNNISRPRYYRGYHGGNGGSGFHHHPPTPPPPPSNA